MRKYLQSLVLLSFCIKLNNGQNICPSGEIYDTCGTACPRTCSNPNPEICTDNCVAGCFCPTEKVRNGDGQCVYLRNCLSRNSSKINTACPPGEEFHNCGTACPPTCSKPFPKICTLQCVQGCFCPKNKFRDANTGKCVNLQNCTCPKGEIFNTCGSACPQTCENQVIQKCTRQCVPGCFCSEGKVRQKQTGKCVDPKDCTKCPEGEIFSNCDANCQPTCYEPRPMICPAICAPGCICGDNKVRSQNETCVKYSDCQICPENEEYTDCINEATCENPNKETSRVNCRRGCTCRHGLIRDMEINECVPIEECPQTEPSECKNGEVFKECGSSCLETCSDPNPVCNKVCKKGCFCPDGQVRDDYNNYKCINRYQCPQH